MSRASDRAQFASDEFNDWEGQIGDEDDIVCRRCGTAGLYWQIVTTADGRGEKSVLFDARTKRPHKCEVSGDAFSVQPE